MHKPGNKNDAVGFGEESNNESQDMEQNARKK